MQQVLADFAKRRITSYNVCYTKLLRVANATAVGQVFVNTNAAAAAGCLGALIVTKLTWGKADLTMVLNGALAGLVAITADPLSPSPLLSVVIGVLAGALVVYAIVAIDKLKIDDPVGAISVHGVCGFRNNFV